MSKVEELRNEVVIYCDPWQRDSVVRVLDSLIAAAREEGAEQERERIRKEGNKVDVFSDGNFLVDDMASIKHRYAGDNRHACLVPLSILVPKEDDNGKN